MFLPAVSRLKSSVPSREGQWSSQSSVQVRPPSRGMVAPPGHRAGHLGPFRPGSGGPESRVRTLNLILAATASQWSDHSRGVMWENLGKLRMRRAAVFWMSCSGWMTQGGRLASKELQ